MIIGSGVDIIEIARVEKAAARPRFVERIFTEREREYWQSVHCAPQTLAGAFAAKEAVAKAFGTGIGEIAWKDIEILHTQNRRPYIELHAQALRLFEELRAVKIHISISHCKQYAIAQAILEGK